MFRTLAAEWHAHLWPIYKHSTQKNPRHTLEKHLLPRFGDKAMTEITRQEVQAYVAHRELSSANPLWGAPRIHWELLKLGIAISQSRHSRLTAPMKRSQCAFACGARTGVHAAVGWSVRFQCTTRRVPMSSITKTYSR